MANFAASLVTGLVIGVAIGYVIILARKFTINQSNSTYGADVMMGAGNSSGRFLGPLIILSAMTASIPIGIGSLLGALLFYIWGKLSPAAPSSARCCWARFSRSPFRNNRPPRAGKRQRGPACSRRSRQYV